MFDTLNNLLTNLDLVKYITIIIGSLIGGAVLVITSKFKESYSSSFLNTVFLLPAIVATIILMVNGNLGTGIAVAGAFSLVRFRSLPGTAKEIIIIFLAMGFGLIMGMGHLIYGFVFLILIILANTLYKQTEKKEERILKITIPEDLNYNTLFDEVLNGYLTRYKLIEVKTTNMGSLFKLTYDIEFKNVEMEKELIDKLRIKNGNLEITSSLKSTQVL